MITRRKALSAMALGSAGLVLPRPVIPQRAPGPDRFRYCLNTSTIRGQDPGLPGTIEIASRAGFEGIEVWINDLQKYLESGLSAQSLKRILDDHGIRVESAIGFAPWLADRGDGFLQMEREMEMLSQIGCTRIAAPPAGLDGEESLDLFKAGEKYAKLLELGRKTGVMPQLEFWGTSPHLWHLGQALMVAAVADDPDGRILPDVYHMFRGGSGFHTLGLLDGKLIEVFHMNDYPGDKPRETQGDADRVYPGDGVAPLRQILTSLREMGGEKVLSLELFNVKLWNDDPLEVAKTGLMKMKKAAAGI